LDAAPIALMTVTGIAIRRVPDPFTEPAITPSAGPDLDRDGFAGDRGGIQPLTDRRRRCHLLQSVHRRQ